jgi:rare lipoprotein A
LRRPSTLQASADCAAQTRSRNPKSGRSVVVTINDRGPFRRGRVIDVSPAAARALGMISRGVIYVRAEVL